MLKAWVWAFKAGSAFLWKGHSWSEVKKLSLGPLGANCLVRKAMFSHLTDID